jgi:hypothetical protein
MTAMIVMKMIVAETMNQLLRSAIVTTTVDGGDLCVCCFVDIVVKKMISVRETLCWKPIKNKTVAV